MTLQRLAILSLAAFALAACSPAPSVRKSIDRAVAKPLPAPQPTVPGEPVVRTLPGCRSERDPADGASAPTGGAARRRGRTVDHTDRTRSGR